MGKEDRREPRQSPEPLLAQAELWHTDPQRQVSYNHALSPLPVP